ncbi:MAG: elongation factor G [Oligosphaeraceae bacterium]
MGRSEDSIRNIGIIAHINAGKTTLTERILHETGELKVCGAVEEGNTISDFLLQERERGISIVSAAVTCPWKGRQYTILDTPGHIDFTAEVERSLRVMDGAVAVFCALRGVQAQSEMVWRRARRYSLPALAFVSKLDREGADFPATLAQMRRLFAPVRPVPLMLPLPDEEGRTACLLDLLEGTTVGFPPVLPPDEVDLQLWEGRRVLLETLAEEDEAVMADYLEGRTPSPERLRAAIRRATLENRIVPVLCGSAKAGWGVPQLLDAVGDFLPSPRERLDSPGGRLCFPVSRERLSSPQGVPYAVMTVVKTVRTPWPGDYVAVRLYSGRLRPGDRLVNVNRGIPWTPGALWRLRADQVQEIPEASEGEVVALAASPREPIPPFRPGDTLSQEGAPPLRLTRMRFPEPVLSLVLEALGSQERLRLPQALASLAEEDPTLRWKKGPRDGQCTVSGLGELHLQVARERLFSEYQVPTRAGTPLVAYRCTVASPALVHREFKRILTPALTVQARVQVQFEPLPPESGAQLEFPAELPGLSPDILPVVRQTVNEFVQGENPSGYPLTNTRITVLEVSSSQPDTSEPVFLTATRLALVDALEQAGTVVLEPVMRLEVSAPALQIGAVLQDLQARKAKVLQVETLPDGGSRAVALVPVANMLSYATSLRSLTGGRALFTAEPAALEKRLGQDS